MSVLYHYTSLEGYAAIIETKLLKPSLRAHNPSDARFGDGQYLSDIAPGTKKPSQLSYMFLGIPFQGRRFTHYVGIDVKGIPLIQGRDHVFVILNREPLEISLLLAGHGENR